MSYKCKCGEEVRGHVVRVCGICASPMQMCLKCYHDMIYVCCEECIDEALADNAVDDYKARLEKESLKYNNHRSSEDSTHVSD